MSSGKNLLSQLATSTGLPEATMANELGRLIDGAGLDSNVVSLDQLRQLLTDYVQDVLLSVKQAHEEEMMKTASGE